MEAWPVARRLFAVVGKLVWITGFDHLGVPLYQAAAPAGRMIARNADLYFGPGEVVGAGQRHTAGEGVGAGLAVHGLPVDEYAWYVLICPPALQWRVTEP